jgi:hypothetical protein
VLEHEPEVRRVPEPRDHVRDRRLDQHAPVVNQRVGVEEVLEEPPAGLVRGAFGLVVRRRVLEAPVVGLLGQRERCRVERAADAHHAVREKLVIER